MSKWSKHSDQNKKENMEEQIQTMLEKVLTDEVEESTVGDMTLYSNLVSATENSENDFSSFIKNARRDKKAFTSKPNLMKNQQDEHLSQNVKRFLELENGFSDSPRKKLKTHNCITGAIHRMQNTPQFQDNDLVILEDNVFDLQNQMMVMNINNTESVQSFRYKKFNYSQFITLVLILNHRKILRTRHTLKIKFLSTSTFLIVLPTISDLGTIQQMHRMKSDRSKSLQKMC